MAIKYLQLPTCKLSGFLGSAVTSFDVSGFLYNDGVTPVDPADIGDICYATIEPKTAREELVSFTIDSVTAAGVATLTVTRGLLQKSPYTVGGAAFDHQSGSDFVISNNPGLFNHLAAKDNNETITGSWSFPTPTAAANAATKDYVDTEITATEGLVTTEAAARVAADSALDAAMVKLTGDQAVAGIKTFSSSPVVPTATTSTQAINKGQAEAYIAANSGDIKASDTAYGTTKLDEPADTPADPVVLTYNAERRNRLSGSFGDGSDGDVVISTPTTLARDMYYNNLTVNSILTTNGYKIFVKNIIDGTGTIDWGVANSGSNGGNAPNNSTGGTAGAGGTQSGAGELKNIAGTSGGTGSSGGDGGNSIAGTNSNPSIGVVGAKGGNGGNGRILGSNGDGGVAGAAGTVTSPVRKFGVFSFTVLFLVDVVIGVLTAIKGTAGSSGGGGGGGDAFGNNNGAGGGGGGAGASGGTICVYARIWAGTFTIKANGGNGGNGGNPSSSEGGNGGGGASGSGGISIFVYAVKTWTGSYNLSAGTAGNQGTGGNIGQNGATGSAGIAYEIDFTKLI